MILSSNAIRERLEKGEIFKRGSWDTDALREASYVLRVAADGLLLDDKAYAPGTFFTGRVIEIKPGKIAILSTMEKLNMPNNLVGRLGIRLDYAARGLTGLMGIQVDPCYGQDRDGESLYIRVVNFGNETVQICPGDKVFTFELQQMTESPCADSQTRESTWERLLKAYTNQEKASWSYITRIESDFEGELKEAEEIARKSYQPVVLFGVFLVAVTILGVAITLILSLRETPSAEIPNWVTSWGWGLLLGTLSLAGLGTAFVAFVAGLRLYRPRK